MSATTASATDYYWEGTGDTGNWSDDKWAKTDGGTANQSFTANSNAIFSGATVATTITVDTNATVETMTVSGAGATYTFNRKDGTQSTITAKSLVINEKASAIFGLNAINTAALTSVTVAKGGVMELAANAHSAFLNLAAVTTGDGTVKLAGASGFGDDSEIRLGPLTESSITTAVNFEISNNVAVHGGGNDKTLIIAKGFAVGNELRMESKGKVKVVDGGNLTATTISLGHSTAGNPGHLEITGGKVTAGTLVSTDNDTFATSANTFKMSGGTLELTTSGAEIKDFQSTITGGTLKASEAVSWGVTGATIGGATIETGTGTITVKDSTLTGALSNTAGNLEFAGTINLDTTNYTPASTTKKSYSEVTNGYERTDTNYQVSVADKTTLTGVTWKVNDSTDGVSYNAGVVTVAGVEGTKYYINSGTGKYTEINRTNGADQAMTAIVLKGTDGFNLNDNLAAGESIEVAYTGSSVVEIAGNKTLAASQLTGTDADSEVRLHGSGTYALGESTALSTGVVLGTGWNGTVIMSNITTPTKDFDISELGREGSSIKMGAVNVKKLTSTTKAAVTADSLTLGGGESQVGGALTLTGNTLTLGSGDASLKAASLTTKSGDLTIAATSQKELDALNTMASQGAVTILTLETGFTGELTQNGIVVMTGAAAPAEKYYTELQWNADNTKLTYASQVNPDYVGKQVAATSQNGLAGVAMLQQALQQVNPQVTAPDGAMAAALNAVDAGELSEEGAAAVAGAATAVLGMAVSGDVDRQLQAIRNRTTTMGVDQSVANEDMPYFNAWINAEGDRSELSESGTEGGYELSSWGGTVGFDVDLCPTFTAGMALTAMYGDIDTTGADKASGNIDTYYVTAFARYAPSAWTHTFVATVGMSDISLDRHVAGAEMEGETDGLSFGLMYEVGRVFALTEDGSTCLQPVFNVTWKHTAIDAYTEDGSDLALEVDEQTLDTVTFGLGARLQTVVGESMYNRTSILEARVLAKADVGDRSGSADVAISALPGAKASVDSAEMGAFGLEAGAGLTIPVGDEGGSIFMDASVELRSDYTNVNGTLGYRINF